MNEIERAADVIFDHIREWGLARALADAGLLLTDADQAVLDAAKREADAHARETIGGVPAPIRCKCHLCLAVRARRERGQT